jgi:plastocyanin
MTEPAPRDAHPTLPARRPRSARPTLATALALASLLTACTSGSPVAGIPSPPAYSPRPPYKVVESPEPSTGPYVTVAVDYHFHDIHPQDHKQISQDRPFIVKNESANLHNFSIAGTSISADVPPGGSDTIPRLGDVLEPGVTYQVYCKYHADRGMGGSFTVVP